MNKALVLLATDFSDDAALAQKQAVATARMMNATILVVHVAHAPSGRQGEGMLHDGAYPDDSPSLERRLRETSNSITDVPCEYRLLRGDPATEILRVAEEESVSTIVMGTHGRTGIFRMLMGSVAEQVVRRAACSVLIVKRPRGNATQG